MNHPKDATRSRPRQVARPAVLAAAVLVLVAAPACSPVDLEACDVDGDCARLHVCEEGVCRPQSGPCEAEYCGPYAEASVIVAGAQSLPADGRSTTTVTVNVRDEAGNRQAGRLVGIFTDRGGLQGPVEDLGDGNYTQTLIASTVAGVATLWFTVDGEPARATTAITFLAGAPERLVLRGAGVPHPGGGTVLRAGEVQTLEITVLDRFENPVALEGVIEVSTTDTEAEIPERVPLIPAQNGTRPIPYVTLNAAGIHRIEVRLRALAPGEALPLEPTPGGGSGEDQDPPDDENGDEEEEPFEPPFLPLTAVADDILVTGADAQTTLVAEPRHLPGSGVSHLTVTVRDGTGAPIEGAEVEIVTSLGEVSEIVDAGGGAYTATLVSGEDGPAQLSLVVDHLTFSARDTVCFGECGGGLGGTWLPIAIDNVGLPTVSDFPLPVALSNDDIDYARTAEGGADLRFYDADAVTPLAHEIERWQPGRTSLVWVSVPELVGDSDTGHIWLHYGWRDADEEDADPISVEDPAAVWGPHYRAVWHLSEDLDETAGRVHDSSGRGHDGDAEGTVTSAPGALSAAVSFDGETGWIDMGMPGDLRLSGTGVTLEAWVRPHPDRGGQDDAVVVKGDATNTERYMLGVLNDGTLDCRFYVEREIIVEEEPQIERTQYRVRGGDVPGGQWTHLACTYDGSTGRAYVDGVQVASQAFTGTLVDAGGDDVRLGRRHDGRFFHGAADEVRIASRAHPATWLAAQVRAMRGEMARVGELPASESD
jgi:hypothetical protein